MSAHSDHPFVPGARVAVDIGAYSVTGVREDRVAKVHKSGRFTLESDPKQQWRAWAPGGWDNGKWTARATGGSGYRSDTLTLWNEATDTEIRERVAVNDRRQRWRAIQGKIERMKPPEHMSFIVAIENALELSERPSPTDTRDAGRDLREVGA